MFRLLIELKKLGVDEAQLSRVHEILGRIVAGEEVTAAELDEAQRGCLELLKACRPVNPRGCFQ